MLHVGNLQGQFSKAMDQYLFLLWFSNLPKVPPGGFHILLFENWGDVRGDHPRLHGTNTHSPAGRFRRLLCPLSFYSHGSRVVLPPHCPLGSEWLKNSKRHHSNDGMLRWNLTFTCVWLAGVGVSVQWVRKRTWLLQNATVRPHKTNVQVTGPLPHCLLLVQILYLQIYSKKAKSCEALFYVTSVYYSCLDSLNEQSERILPNCGKELDTILLVASIPCAFAFLPSANTNFLHRSDSGKCQRWLVLLCLSSFIFILPVFLIIQLLSVSFSFILYNMDFLGAFDRVWQLLAVGFEMLASETIRKQHFTERSLWCLALPSELTSIFV